MSMLKQRCVGKEEEVCEELGHDLRVNSNLLQEVIGRLEHIDDLLHAIVTWRPAAILGVVKEWV